MTQTTPRPAAADAAPNPREIEAILDAAGLRPSLILLQPQARGYAHAARSAGYQVERSVPALVFFFGVTSRDQATGLSLVRRALRPRYVLQRCWDADDNEYLAVIDRT